MIHTYLPLIITEAWKNTVWLVILTTTAVFMCFLISFLVCWPTGLSAAQTLRPPAGTFQFLTFHDGFFVNICRSDSSYCRIIWAFRIMLRIMTVRANVLKAKVYLQLELFLETEIKLSTFIGSRVQLLSFDVYPFSCVFTFHKFGRKQKEKREISYLSIT